MSLRKQIKRILREAVGVPEGIHDSAETFMSELIANLGNLDESHDDFFETTLTFENPLRINDLTLEKLDVAIRLHRQDFQVDEVELMGAGVPAQTKGKPDLTKKNPVIGQTLDKDNLFIYLDFAIDDEMGIEEVKQWFLNKQNSKNLISTIAHELKHLYDNFKQEYKSVKSMVDYSVLNKTAKNEVGGLCQPVQEKFFLMYFLSNIETLVRPTEVYSHMMTNNITKEGFLEELKTTRIYENILKGINYKTEVLENELMEDFDCVDSILKVNNFPFMNYDKEEKIESYMGVIPDVVLSTSAKSFVGYIMSFDKGSLMGAFGELAKLFGINVPEYPKDMELKQKRMDEYLQKIKTRAENPEKFYDFLEKSINFNANKALRKISKVYSLLPSENENEIHSKINRKEMKETDYINYDFYKKKAQKEKNYQNETIKKVLDELKKKNPPQK
jgi:hypothetical protein